MCPVHACVASSSMQEHGQLLINGVFAQWKRNQSKLKGTLTLPSVRAEHSITTWNMALSSSWGVHSRIDIFTRTWHDWHHIQCIYAPCRSSHWVSLVPEISCSHIWRMRHLHLRSSYLTTWSISFEVTSSSCSWNKSIWKSSRYEPWSWLWNVSNNLPLWLDLIPPIAVFLSEPTQFPNEQSVTLKWLYSICDRFKNRGGSWGGAIEKSD